MRGENDKGKITRTIDASTYLRYIVDAMDAGISVPKGLRLRTAAHQVMDVGIVGKSIRT